MKQEDINKLKELCESNGYYFDFDVISETAVVAKPKDIWEGVEFVYHPESNKIYKVMCIRRTVIDITKSTVFIKSQCKPSTEEAYIEQLKNEAFERFGYIKEGDVFDRTTIDKSWDIVTMEKDPFGKFRFLYDKTGDILLIGRYGIYKKGKWAKKIEKAEVKANGGNTSLNWFYFKMNEEAKEKCKEIGYFNVCEYLAKQLEDYLNKKE